MEFDSMKYLELINNFIKESEQVRTFRASELKTILKPVCSFFHIGKLCVRVNCPGCLLDSDVPFDYYNSGSYDELRVISKDFLLTDGGNASYFAYSEIGSEEWLPQERKQISALLRAVFVMNERSYFFKLAKEMTLPDNGLGAYSLPYFLSTLHSAIEKGSQGGFGAVYFNLRRFSVINEHIGREMADSAMRGFVQGLSSKLGYGECVCRIGGDNFVMLFRREKLSFVQDYLSGTTISYFGTEKINITATAGCYLIPEDSTESETDILDKVSTALHLAKSVYKRQFLFYDEKIMRQQEQIREIEEVFPLAIEHEEFQVFYQPKTELENNRLAGAEALCRWFRNGRIVSPGEFIPILEGSSAICTLDFYMLEHVCRDIRRWLDEGREVVKVSVNLSRLHLGDQELLDTVLEIIDRNCVPHEYIEIELTETTTDVDYAELKKIVNGLREQGISTSVDDFGVGYSSLNLIREMPWNVLKIDKSFLPDMSEKQDPSKIKMLRHIITMSQDLGLECIVEGVETLAQVKLLIDCKCYLAQGFYFDKPLPVGEFEKRLGCKAS